VFIKILCIVAVTSLSCNDSNSRSGSLFRTILLKVIDGRPIAHLTGSNLSFPVILIREHVSFEGMDILLEEKLEDMCLSKKPDGLCDELEALFLQLDWNDI
jgi:hypothetical protein